MQIKTRVKGNHRAVFARFDQAMLLKLTPPGMRMQITHFQEPYEPNAKIGLKVTILGLIRQDWENHFTLYEQDDALCHFIDEGTKMPFPIKFWRHDHRVQADGPDHAIINDDVTFKTGFFLLDWLLFPVLWLQFRYRRPIYRRTFGKG